MSRSSARGNSSGELRDESRADVAPARARIVLAAILAIALVVRVVYVVQSRTSPAFTDPQLDALYHVEWARAFAAGHEYQPGPFFRAPLYPWFLGTLFRIVGEDLTVVRLVQACIGTLSCALVYLIGARAFDRRTGLVAAFLASTYWILVYFDGEILLPVLEVFFSLLTLWCALRFQESRTWRLAAWCGLALGFVALVRPNFLVLAPILAAWMWFAEPKDEHASVTRRARPVGAFVLAIALSIAPITAYNVFVGGDRVLISSQAGVNLWIGNNASSDGASAIAPGTRQDWWGGFEDTVKQAELAEGRALKPSEVSSYYTHKALHFWTEDPPAAIALTLRKVRYLWMDWEIGNNQDERFFALHFGPILRFLPIGFGVLAPLALLGFVLALRRPGSNVPLWSFVPAYSATVVAFFVCSRYRVPLLPVVMIFAAHALWIVVDSCRARQWTRIAMHAAFLLIVGAAVHSVPSYFDTTESKGLWQLGLASERQGDLDSALDLYRRAVTENPLNANAHRSLGAGLYRLGRIDEARAALQEALRLDPTMVLALQVQSEIDLSTGHFAGAIASARRMQAVSPTYAPGYYAEGAALYARARAYPQHTTNSDEVQRDLEAADLALRAASARATSVEDRFNAAFARGEVAMLRSVPRVAIEAYEEALRARSEPDEGGWFWQAQERRLKAYVAAGDAETARSMARELRTRFSSDPRVLVATRDLLP